MKRLLVILLAMIIMVPLSSCAKPSEKRYEASFLDVFDTVTKIVGYAKSEKEFKQTVQQIHDRLKEYHELFDIYHNYDGINNLKTINDNAGIAPVKVDQKIIDLILLSKKADYMSNDKINIAFGAVLKIWHDYRTNGLDDPEHAKLPPMDQLKAMVAHTDINNVIIDEENATVYLKDQEMSLDVGAIAKGYATEMVSQYAEKNGLKNGMLSVGGNVRTIGHKFDKQNKPDSWSVGIQNPDLESEKKNLFILGLENYSLVTSGVYERYYTVGEKQYHHIIDPVTLMPSTYFLSVSIVCRDSGMADALSTSIFNMSYEDGLKFVQTLDDVEVLWVFPDGSMKSTPNFKNLVKE